MKSKIKYTKSTKKSFNSEMKSFMLSDEYGQMGSPMSKEEVQKWMDSTGNSFPNKRDIDLQPKPLRFIKPKVKKCVGDKIYLGGFKTN